jgi:hypothetical protein
MLILCKQSPWIYIWHRKLTSIYITEYHTYTIWDKYIDAYISIVANSIILNGIKLKETLFDKSG